MAPTDRASSVPPLDASDSEDGSDGVGSDKSDLFGCMKDTLSADKDKLAMPPPSVVPQSPIATPGR